MAMTQKKIQWINQVYIPVAVTIICGLGMLGVGLGVRIIKFMDKYEVIVGDSQADIIQLRQGISILQTETNRKTEDLNNRVTYIEAILPNVKYKLKRK